MAVAVAPGCSSNQAQYSMQERSARGGGGPAAPVNSIGPSSSRVGWEKSVTLDDVVGPTATASLAGPGEWRWSEVTLSDGSAAAYRRWASLMRPAIGSLRLLCCEDQATAERFTALGASPQRVVVTGNIKSDLRLDPALPERIAATRAEIAVQDVAQRGSRRLAAEETLQHGGGARQPRHHDGATVGQRHHGVWVGLCHRVDQTFLLGGKVQVGSIGARSALKRLLAARARVVGALLAVGIAASGLASGLGFVAPGLGADKIFGGVPAPPRAPGVYKTKGGRGRAPSPNSPTSAFRR